MSTTRSNFLPFEHELWIETIRGRVKPKLVEINLKAFERGRNIQLEPAKA